MAKVKQLIIDTCAISFFTKNKKFFNQIIVKNKMIIYTLDNIRGEFSNKRENDHMDFIYEMHKNTAPCQIEKISEIYDKNFTIVKKRIEKEFNDFKSTGIDDKWYFFKLSELKKIKLNSDHIILTYDKGIKPIQDHFQIEAKVSFIPWKTNAQPNDEALKKWKKSFSQLIYKKK